MVTVLEKKTNFHWLLQPGSVSSGKVILLNFLAHCFSHMEKNLGLPRFFCFVLFCFELNHAACGILVPWSGVELMSPVMEAQNLNHWTAREIPRFVYFQKTKIYSNTEHTISSLAQQGSLVCCSPQDLEESDTTEWLDWTGLKFHLLITPKAQVTKQKINKLNFMKIFRCCTSIE